ncbi:MAG: N-acetylmuramoyl-L-alanine amidase [Bacteroidaceae bacterium]|nr:N-acetylmuramoyl-L-alanine amidase [Bacteroidaceae bacterium]
MRRIERIFVHCTAGSQKATDEDLRTEFRRKGWKNPGYHYVVLADGRAVQLLEEAKVSNGVKGYNSTSINVAYTGGVKDGRNVDTRTEAQRITLRHLLHDIHSRYPKAQILGHRDISPDKNKNGIVDPWERIKDCPCFDAREEYKDL